MHADPIIEEFRITPRNGSFCGVVTLAYPSKVVCVMCGLFSKDKVTRQDLRKLIEHVRSRGRKSIEYYRQTRFGEKKVVIKV